MGRLNLRCYNRRWFAFDCTAGLTAAAVVLPKALAYATIAGLPVQIGLYTCIMPMFIYALLGTSAPLSVSTTTTIAILTGAELAEVAPGSGTAELLAATATLTALVGIILLCASFLRLGFVANFISEPVLAGFKTGIGLVIVIDQLPKVLGVHIDKQGLFRDIASIAIKVPEASTVTVVFSLSLFLLLYALHRFFPKLPSPLIVVAAAIALSGGAHLDTIGIHTVGAVPQGLPSLTLPSWSLVSQLWTAAAGIALMSFTETIAAARAFADPEDSRPVPNQELFAIGAANIAGGFFGAMPAGGGTTQTAVNRSAGAKTQLAEIVTALTAVAVLLFLAPFISLMPQAALAAVVIAFSVELIKIDDFREILRVRRAEFYWAVIAFLGVAMLGTLKGIVVAVIASLIALAHQTYNPPIYVLGRKRETDVFRPLSPEHPDDETWPGLLMVRVAGRVYFANAETVGEKLLALIKEAQPSVLLLDCSAMFDLEFTALKMLINGERKLREAGTELWLTALNPAVLEVVRNSTLGDMLGRNRMIFTNQAAVEKFVQEKSRP